MNYDLNIVRSARRTVSVSVSTDNKITLRCPLKMTEKKVLDYLDSKKEWIDKIIAKNTLRINSFNALYNYEEILINGKRFPLKISDKIDVCPEAVYIKKRSDIKGLFLKYLSEEFIEYAKKIAFSIDLTANKFSLKSYKSRWGCCDKKNNITFNYLLIMLPTEIQRYVIIHELCHTKIFNHSDSFWRLVFKFEPDYKNIRKRLKEYGFIIKIYCG